MKSLVLLAGLCVLSQAGFKQKLNQFSFDCTYDEYPSNYDMSGATVGLLSKVKLVPWSRPTHGSLFLNQPVKTLNFETVLDINFTPQPYTEKIKDEEDDDFTGFAVWYLHKKPQFPFSNGKNFGL